MSVMTSDEFWTSEVLVVCQHQVLTHDDADDQGHHGPEHHGVELPGEGFLEDRDDGGQRDRQVGQYEPDPAGCAVVGDRGACPCRGGPKTRYGDQQVAGGPARVRRAAAAVGVGGGQIGERAVGQQVGDEPTRQQDEGQPVFFGRPRGQDQDDRADDDVARWVREADQLRDQTARAGSVDRAQDGGPADDEERAGDQQRVQDGPEQGRGAGRHPREEEHAGDREGHGAEKAEVREGREGHLLPDDQLVVRPDRLTHAPEQRGGADQSPGDPSPLLVTPASDTADGGGDKGGQGFAQVVEALGDHPAAPLKLQPGREKQGETSPTDEHRQEAAVACHSA